MQPIETARSPAERAFELLKDAPLGVLLIDSDLRIREVNGAARQILEQIPGTSLREVAHLVEARGGVICYLGGNERWEAAPPRVAELLPSGEPPPSSRMKDDFLATVSHELRSPLQGILGWLTLLQGGRLDAAQTARALQSVERSVRLQAQLVNPTTLEFTLTYANLEGGPPTVAHIHIGQIDVSGMVSVFFCGGGGKPMCPATTSGMVTGTIVPGDVLGPPVQGVPAGNFDKLLRAMRAGLTYANVHNATSPAGEIRGQIRQLN